jgi:hypothetical protein
VARSPRSQPHWARGLAATPQQQIDPGVDEGVYGECLYQPHFPAAIAGVRRNHLSWVGFLRWNKRQWYE